MISIAADGRIEIDTKINEDGISQGGNRISTIMGRVAKSVRGVANANAEAFGAKQQQQINRLTQQLERKQESLRKEERNVEAIKRQYEAIAGAETTPASLKRMESELAKTQREIQKTEKEYANLEQQLQKVQQVADFEKLASGAISPGNAAEIERLVGELDKAGGKLGDLDDKSNQLQASIQKIKLDPAQTEEAQRLADKLQNAQEKAERLSNETNVLAEELANAANESSGIAEWLSSAGAILSAIHKISTKIMNTTKKIGKTVGELNSKLNKLFLGARKGAASLTDSVDKLRKRILRLAAAALVFNVLRKSFTQLRNYLWDVMQTNQQFINSLALVKGNLLTAFQPIYEAILPALNALAAALARVTAYLAAFISLLFGKSVSGSSAAAKSLYDQAKALGAVGSAAKDAAGKLAAFDEINVLAQENAESGGGGGSDVIYPDFDYDFTAIEDFFNQFENWPDAFYELGKRIAESTAKALGYINWTEVQKKAREIAASIAQFINGFIDTPEFWYQIGRTVGEGINTAAAFAEEFADWLKWHELGEMMAYSLNTAIDTWDPELTGRAIYKLLNGAADTAYTFLSQTNWKRFGEKIATMLNTAIYGTDWNLIGRTFASKWNVLISTLYGIVSTFDWKEFGLSIATAVNGWFNEIKWDEVAGVINDGFIGLLDMILVGLAGINWDDIGDTIGQLLVDIKWLDIITRLYDAINFAIAAAKHILLKAVLKIGEEFAGSLAEGVKNDIGATVDLFSDLWETVVRFGEESWDKLSNIWSIASDWYDENVTRPVEEYFAGLWDSVVSLFTDSWDTIKSVWETVSGWFSEAVITPMTEGFKAAVNNILGFFEGLANGAVSAIETAVNWIIDALNKISFDIPDWVPGIGGKSFGINIPNVSLGKVSIPKLATGAVIPPNSEFLAILGDQKSGTNIEAPLNTITDAVLTALENAEIGGGDINVNINFTGDLAALARVLNPVIKVENRRTGTNLIAGGAY